MATVVKRGKSYKITVSCGYDINGKQIRKHKTWNPPAGMTERQIQKELERQKVLFEEHCRTGQMLNGNIRLSDFIDIWMKDYASQQLRPTTLAGYRQYLKRIIPALGHIRLEKLQPHHLQSFYNNLAETGIRGDGKYIDHAGNVKQWIEAQKSTMQQLADQAGVSITTVRQIVHGKNISYESAKKVATACGQPLDALFTPVNADRTLSGNSINHYHALLSSILSTAVQWQVIYSNPCDRIKPPKVERKEAQYLDDQQAAHLLELLAQLPDTKLCFRTAITMLLFTGIRRSELLGLNWSDVDMHTGVISINRTSKYLSHQGLIEDDTKNTSSRRSFKAPVELLPLLRKYRAYQLQQRLQVGDKWQDSERIFTNWNGSPLRPDTLTNQFRHWIATTDLPPIHPHSLRHTNATLLIANGTNIQTVAKRLGHSTSTTTANIYAHAVQSADAAAAEAVSVFKANQKKA